MNDIAVAVVAAISALAGALVGGTASFVGILYQEKKQGDRQLWEATSRRFADWQMHKRAVYAELLAAREEATEPDSAVHLGPRLEAALGAAVLVADADLRRFLTTPGWRDVSATELASRMVMDVDRKGS